MSILASLTRAYERMKDAPPFGYAAQDIQFFLEIDQNGDIIGKLQAFDYEKKGHPISRSLVVPYFGGRSGSNAPPYFLWDNSAYVLGVSGKENFDAAKRFEAFRTQHLDALAQTTDPGLVALRRFLNTWSPEKFKVLKFPEDAKDRNIVFRLTGQSNFIHESEESARIWSKIYIPDTIGEGICLISGERAQIARLHPPIKSFDNPARIVSFDKDNDAFSSYGHVQAENAPTSIISAFRYTAVLNHFLARDSGHRIQIGDASTVFWADGSEAKVAEGIVSAIFEGEKDQIDESSEAKKVKAILEKLRRGHRLEDFDPGLAEDVRFCVLGLAPNAARLSVRYWFEDDFGHLAENFQAYLQDIAFEPWPPHAPMPSIRRCEECIAPATRDKKSGKHKFDFERISPLLAGELLRAILTGRQFPRSLLSLLLMRVRSDGVLSHMRAALIKAVIARSMRLEGRLPIVADNESKENYLMRSDPNDPNPSRRLGRLFALIERAQLAALGDDLNATVADKFLGAASATPGRVMHNLIRKARDHHIKRLRNGHSDAKWIKNSQHARSVAAGLDRDIGLLTASFADGFPGQLSTEEQGLFLIGYYQERYGSKSVSTDSEAITGEDTNFMSEE